MMDNGIISFNVEINAKVITSLLQELSCDGKVVIGICNDDNRELSYKEIKDISEAVFLKNKRDIVCLVVQNNYNLASECLVNSEAEVVVMYISDNSTSVYHTLEMTEDSFSLHKAWIKEKKCNYIITWVVNEDGLYVHYDPRQIKKKELLSKLSNL